MFDGDSASSRPGTVTWSRRACTSCDGTRYRIVVSSDLCPIQCCTVRTSKPVRSVREQRRSKCLQVEFVRIEPGAYCHGLAVVEHVVFAVPFRRRETRNCSRAGEVCALSDRSTGRGSAPPALPSASGRNPGPASRSRGRSATRSLGRSRTSARLPVHGNPSTGTSRRAPSRCRSASKNLARSACGTRAAAV